MNILRFITIGSVDDGKSTLIGRLLYDGGAVFHDQLYDIESKNGGGVPDLALLTDGLKAEREQGITIDVAYKYFSSSKRKFIMIDAPGHIQYTKNMVTGASNASLAVVLIDARNGVVEQTRRHAFIAHLLGLKTIVCVNKMDLVDYSEDVFEGIKKDYLDFIKSIDGEGGLHFIPVVAISGDNIIKKSLTMGWYRGDDLLTCLENIDIDEDIDERPSRFPVQYIIRPQTDEYHDYRGYSGQIQSGSFREGDEITILPEGHTSLIKSINVYDKQTLKRVDFAHSPMSVTIELKDDLDVSRGNIIVKRSDYSPKVSSTLSAYICWLDKDSKLSLGNKYIIRQQTFSSVAYVKSIFYKIDVRTMDKLDSAMELSMNDIGQVELCVSDPLAIDSYKDNKYTGSFILVDEYSNNTLAACIKVD